jgi:hypothetical protein
MDFNDIVLKESYKEKIEVLNYLSKHYLFDDSIIYNDKECTISNVCLCDKLEISRQLEEQFYTGNKIYIKYNFRGKRFTRFKQLCIAPAGNYFTFRDVIRHGWAFADNEKYNINEWKLEAINENTMVISIIRVNSVEE